MIISKKNERGFSLVEILVAIAIIGVLSSIVLASINNIREKAKIAKAKVEIDQIYKAIFRLALDTDEWPGHQTPDIVCTSCGNNEICGDGCLNNISSGKAGLTQNDTLDPYTGWDGPYMKEIPLDPWGNQYFFDTDFEIPAGGTKYVVIGSYGLDGKENNKYDAEAVDNIMKILPAN